MAPLVVCLICNKYEIDEPSSLFNHVHRVLQSTCIDCSFLKQKDVRVRYTDPLPLPLSQPSQNVEVSPTNSMHV